MKEVYQCCRQSREVLLVEDNPADARITLEAMKEAGVCDQITVLQEGDETLQFLRRQGRFAKASLPDLILLDLNLPGKDGREILAEIKKDPDLKQIPVIVLTTSQAEQDVATAYELHANCYIVKPLSYERILEAMKSVGEFWFGIAKLPAK